MQLRDYMCVGMELNAAFNDMSVIKFDKRFVANFIENVQNSSYSNFACNF